MNKDLNVSIEKLIGLFIIACGEWNGVQWEYFPTLPKPFTDGLEFKACGKADFLRITLNDLGGVEAWVIDGKEDFYYYSLDELESEQPMLYAAIITHVFDMIENVEC